MRKTTPTIAHNSIHLLLNQQYTISHHHHRHSHQHPRYVFRNAPVFPPSSANLAFPVSVDGRKAALTHVSDAQMVCYINSPLFRGRKLFLLAGALRKRWRYLFPQPISHICVSLCIQTIVFAGKFSVTTVHIFATARHSRTLIETK
jgi:hypothetical protein